MTMGIKLADLTRDTRTIAVPVGEETLNVTYQPSWLTPETEEKLHKLGESGRAGQSLVSFLLPCLVSWDLLDDDGQPLPLADKTLRKLPIKLLSQIVQAVGEDMRPNLTSGETSAAGSLLKDG